MVASRPFPGPTIAGDPVAVQVKICGIKSVAALQAAAEGGADFVGFVFYPPSPRAVTPTEARELIAAAPAGIRKVGLFVDPDDATLDRTLAEADLDMLQLQGDEAPERVEAIRRRYGRLVMRALRIATAVDFAAVARFEPIADWLMFDGVPPKDMKGALPGGNAARFDWTLLRGRRFAKPWMLSGGLDPGNVAEAIRISGASCVDVSSGVEASRGVKDPAKIRAFLRAAKAAP